MGSLSSCLTVPDVEETADLNGSDNGSFGCFGSLVQRLKLKYGDIFGRGEKHLSDQGADSSDGVVALGDLSDANSSHSESEPLPNNGSLQMQPPVVGTMHMKGSSQSHVELEPESSFQVIPKVVTAGDKLLAGSCSGGGPKECHSESSGEGLLLEVESKFSYISSSSEDEYVCPTCLEEYTQEDPEITLQCSHHYHLGCIYEWMERSKTCPVCGKLMVFTELA